MAQRSRWFEVILAGRLADQRFRVVIVHLRSAGSGVADVLEQQRGQLDQQVGLELRRQLVPARNRLARAAGTDVGGGGLSVGVHVVTSVLFLRVGETLLAPTCQFQEDLGRDYRMR